LSRERLISSVISGKSFDAEQADGLCLPSSREEDFRTVSHKYKRAARRIINNREK
jgi:hypothetical protein